MSTVAVIDYGMGNLHSVAKALEHAGVAERVQVTAEIRRLGLDDVVREVAAAGTPLLGVCVGMQAMLDWSAENDGTDCLGLLPGKVLPFGPDLHDPASGARLKIPHMGWNPVHQIRSHPLWPADPALVAATTEYGHPFASALSRDNVFAVQFHPEKSQQAGLQLYANFLRWDGTI